MLFLEPVKNYETEFPPKIAGIIFALSVLGFRGYYREDIALINRELPAVFIEENGKFFYDGKVVGYLRALRPSQSSACGFLGR